MIGKTTDLKSQEGLAIRGHHLKNLRDAIRNPENYWAKLFDYVTLANPEEEITIVAGIPTSACTNCRIKTRWHYDRCEGVINGESEDTRKYDTLMARASGFQIGDTYKVGDLLSKLKSQNIFGRTVIEMTQIFRYMFSQPKTIKTIK